MNSKRCQEGVTPSFKECLGNVLRFSRMQYEFLNSPIQKLRDIKHILGRARDFVDPSELFELLARFAKHAENLAIEAELVDASRVRVRCVQHLTRAGSDANRPRRARRL